MPMDRKEHEILLTELLNPELEQARKVDILQSIRVDHVTAHVEVDTLAETNKKIDLDNKDLLLANSKLFRSLGITETIKDAPEEKQKEFSEMVTIEGLEKGLK